MNLKSDSCLKDSVLQMTNLGQAKSGTLNKRSAKAWIKEGAAEQRKRKEKAQKISLDKRTREVTEREGSNSCFD